VPVEQKMLTHEKSYLLVLFRASFFCPYVAFCSMSKNARSHGGNSRAVPYQIILVPRKFCCAPKNLF